MSAPLIDWCTAILDSEKAKAFCRTKEPVEIVRALLAVGSEIAAGPLRDVALNYYPRSAVLVDCTGSRAGAVAVRHDGAVQVVLAGQGCQFVADWPAVADRLDALDAHVSRVDIAVDDLDGDQINVHAFKKLHGAGGFSSNGRPPLPTFVDDMGTGHGSTLYIGRRGHKQLCVYEKGRQLGDPTSRHTRCEPRLYAKRIALPNDVLRRPGAYFGGAYPALADHVGGELAPLEVKKAVVNATAIGMVHSLRRQSGRSLGLLDEAFGEHAAAFLAKEVLRPGRPRRFRDIAGNVADLIRQELAHKLPGDPVMETQHE